jgi:hypothetical protein
MQRKAIAGGELPLGHARSLGVSDALQLELAPVQLPWLIDELEEMRGPLEEEVQRAGAGCAASGPNETDRRDLEYELRLLRLMRARLPAASHQEPFVFIGPSGMVQDVVHGTMRNVAGALSELASGRVSDDPESRAGLRDTAAAAAAWVDTFLECQAVVGFKFDPHADPMTAW